jgi:hypothetical protein
MLGEIGTATQAGATVLGVLIGAAWAIYLYLNRRKKFAWANVAHQITDIRFNRDKVLLRIVISITNVGDVLLPIEHCEVRVNQIFPFEEDQWAELHSDSGIEDFNQTDTEWPTLVIRERNWDEKKFEIEPSEGGEINFDFIISSDVKTIEIYTYFDNLTKSTSNLGWRHTSLYEIANHEFVD